MTKATGSIFDERAASWDDNPNRVRLTASIAEAMLGRVRPAGDVDCLDFGSGTGLLALALLDHVRSMTCVDSSRGMLDKLAEKIGRAGLSAITLHQVDPGGGGLPPGPFGLIVSAMTFHHVEDPAGALARLHACCAPGGRLCVADLEPDGGLFHEDNRGVHHHGFALETMGELLTGAGFRVESLERAAEVTRPAADGSGLRTFGVFLAVGSRE